MSRAFASALSVILHHEGGYSNHPSDPGGATFKGITQRVLDEYRGTHPELPARVIDLSEEHIGTIYRARYWNPIHGDSLPECIALMAFDCAVNQGVGRAVQLLQTALRVEPDGVMGPATNRAAWQGNHRAIVREYAARRMFAYMLLDKIDDTFGLGWSRRLVDIIDRSLRLAPP
jgi:lysozyme family protein